VPTFQVINRRAKLVLGEVTVDDPSAVLDALAEMTGTAIEEIAESLGKTVEEAKAALDIVELSEPRPVRHSERGTRQFKARLSPKRIFASAL
jgi:hypothetical protein